MALTLEILSRQRATLGERARCRFAQRGGNIGRSLECDWVLPDAERFVSSRHAAIDFRAGSYYLVDLSTNGVYINDADTPIGRGQPQQLFAGDRLRLGEYLILVHVEEIDDLTAALLDDAPDAVRMAQQVEALTSGTVLTLVDEFEMTGSVDLQLEKTNSGEAMPPSFRPGTTQPIDAAMRARQRDDAAVLSGRTATVASESSQPDLRRVKLSLVEGTINAGATRSSAPAQPGMRSSAPTQPGTRAKTDGTDEDELLAVFARAAGLDANSLAHTSAKALVHTLGQLLRETVVGVTEALHDRAGRKQSLRMGTATSQPRHDNPLKFSAGVQEAMVHLLTGSGPEYMDSVPAMREAFRDIKEHQAAMMSAMQQAFFDFVERLDPAEIEQRFETGGRRKALLPGSGKARNWEQYAELYEVLTRHTPGQLPQIFSEEFARAYADALQTLQAARQRA
jgi:type VI secretion system FHA domain protein